MWPALPASVAKVLLFFFFLLFEQESLALRRLLIRK